MWQTKETTILTAEEIARLEMLKENGEIEQMLSFLQAIETQGIAEGRFTERRYREDLEMALWYADALQQKHSYEAYYECVQRMAGAEAHAAGCGRWYYWYANALLYCGNGTLAKEYAERGVQEDVLYAWGWFLVAKLRSHFGALRDAWNALAQALALEPGNEEFLLVQEELRNGSALEQLEWVSVQGELEHAPEKQMQYAEAIAGIVCDPQALATLQEALQVQEWRANQPYCECRIPFAEGEVGLVFCMNDALVSKLDLRWLQGELFLVVQQQDALKENLKEEGYGACRLHTIFVQRSHEVELYFYNEETREGVTLHQQWMADEEEGVAPEPLPPLVRLYKQQPDGLHYFECWYDGIEKEVYVHQGIVGETGETWQSRCDSTEKYAELQQMYTQQLQAEGYEAWSEEKYTILVAQFPIAMEQSGSGLPTPAESAIQLQQDAFEALSEMLGWYGLGLVSDWTMGASFDEKERFVLNFFCTVVDAELALGVMLQALERRVDCSQLKIGQQMEGPLEYTVRYAADFSETFSL